MDQIPKFLGGYNENDFLKDNGPWKEYEVVDSTEPGAKVGIRRINDPLGEVFTANDIMELENYLIEGENKGVWGTSGSCKFNE
jgi:hypothetical protein